jgi:SAM-dependent methyltransferase
MDPSEYDKMYRLEEANWWYVGRRDLVLKMAAQVDNGLSDKPLKILDAGCGTGINLKYFQILGDVYGLDISKNALIFSRIRGLPSLICGSVDKLPFKNGLFNLVLALDVIEHIDEDISAVMELNRVLKPGGCLIITVPAFRFLWTDHDLAVHHKRRYTRSGLLNILQLGGFETERATYWNSFLFLPVATVRLLKRFYRSGDDIQTDLAKLPSPLNGLLLGLIRIENEILKRFDSPVGISVICICRKISNGQDETKSAGIALWRQDAL